MNQPSILDLTHNDLMAALDEMAAARNTNDYERMGRATAMLQAVNARRAPQPTVQQDS